MKKKGKKNKGFKNNKTFIHTFQEMYKNLNNAKEMMNRPSCTRNYLCPISCNSELLLYIIQNHTFADILQNKCS